MQASRRWHSLDVFRAIAVISMVQGHVFTALVYPAGQPPHWPRLYTLIHGLTAPMFLVGAGLAYGIATVRAQVQQRAAFKPRVLIRACVLLAIGYVLQFPGLSVVRAHADPALVSRALAVGPLQLIAGCLLTAECLRVLTRDSRHFAWVVGALLLLVVVPAPLVWNAHPSARLPLAIGTWLDRYAGSLFPAVPWCAFFWLGVLASRLPAPARVRVFTLGGAAAAALAYGLYKLEVNPYGEHEFWHTSPLYVSFRAGLVFIWLGVLCRAEAWFVRIAAERRELYAPLDTLSRESLVAYVGHLLLLYGTPLTPGFTKLPMRSLELASVSLAIIATGTWLMVKAWPRMHRSFFAAPAPMRGSLIALILFLFIRR